MTNLEDKHKWYVVRAITGQEKKVKHNVQVELERDNKLSYVPEILIPTEKVYQVKNGKKVIKERNAFPGYILVRADFSDPEACEPLDFSELDLSELDEDGFGGCCFFGIACMFFEKS